MADTAPTQQSAPKPQQQQKKKKKNAPDRPQPTWLFPPDEENPVLNPKPKSDEVKAKEVEERLKALDYMKRRVHAVPDQPAPPPQLLTIVGVFLTNFGFNSTSRLFTSERTARRELNGWEDAIGQKLEKGIPPLEQIYRDWYREFQIKQKNDTSSSSEGEEASDSDSGVEVPAQDSADSDSEASSDGLGGSDIEMKEAPKNKKKPKAGKKVSSGTSSESSSSDSDADDEQEVAKPKASVMKKASIAAKPDVAPKAVGEVNNKLKRKASPSDDSETSDNDSDEEELPNNKKAKSAPSVEQPAILPPGYKPPTTKAKKVKQAPPVALSEDSSSTEISQDEASDEPPTPAEQILTNGKASSGSDETNSDDSEHDALQPAKKADDKKQPNAAVPAMKATRSDSSATVDGDTKKLSDATSDSSDTSASSSSDSDNAPKITKTSAKAVTPVTKEKKKHQGAKPTPLAELSSNTQDDSVISNKYKNYDYADKAYKDLSVTRGKGFTKEKNKKKRGSYRGGAIDTSGGKAHKFED